MSKRIKELNSPLFIWEWRYDYWITEMEDNSITMIRLTIENEDSLRDSAYDSFDYKEHWLEEVNNNWYEWSYDRFCEDLDIWDYYDDRDFNCDMYDWAFDTDISDYYAVPRYCLTEEWYETFSDINELKERLKENEVNIREWEMEDLQKYFIDIESYCFIS